MTTDAAWLMTPDAIRTQCGAIFDLGIAGALNHFDVHLEQLPACADEVVATIRAHYPDLNVPPHARWRHFVLDGVDRWAPHIVARHLDPRERARVECELAILSVLLDAGAGPDWVYRDACTGKTYSRSEGLALASLEMYVRGGFGGATADALSRFTVQDLAEGFQAGPGNPLEGLEGRAALIAALGGIVGRRSDVFGTPGRLGALSDHLINASTPELPAAHILATVLDVFGPIWPGTSHLSGVALGDCWPHPQAPAPGFVPFHKLSQWLSYSLIEPLQRAGVQITELDALTGLAEYRNGGLFIDTGVLSLKHDLDAPVAPQSAVGVEWRALTVTLLDQLAELVREKLQKSASEMPLAAVLEGGTWATGRQLAQALRPGGVPPIKIVSSGTVF